MANYDDDAIATRGKLNDISPSMCMAKWLQVSLHLPQGRTHSCYHPPTHAIPLDELKANPNALHNTQFKLHERRQMLNGDRPKGCQYCWNVEDAANPPEGGRLSDRHYRSSEWWVKDAWNEVVENAWDHDIAPRYVEVNFNQACNFKCAYCSPHLSTAWEDDIKEHGSFNFDDGGGHNNVQELKTIGLMPLEVARKDNPYIEAFWKWFPDIYSNLKIFRMTGGEPLMDKNTFKVLDYIRDNPNPDLEVSLTTNMCPPDDALFDKFIEKVKVLEEPLIAENDPTVIEVDFDTLFEKPKSNDDGLRNIIFYVKDPKDGSHWKTWTQYILEETLHGIIAHEIQPNVDTISAEDIKQEFTGLGPCIEPDDNSFLYMNHYKRNNEWGKWNHIFDNVACKHISVFISVDGIGPQAEYMRDGLDFEKLKRNVDRLLTETTRVSVTFINTFNLLSVPSLRGFLDYMLELREKYGYQYQIDNKHKVLAQKIWFDLPYLRDPNWFNIQLCDQELLTVIEDNIDYMKANVCSDEVYGKTYKGFKNYEVLKLERDLAWAKEGEIMYEDELSDRLIRFYQYFTQYDKRRGLNFLETFPEMKEFWEEAAEEYQDKYHR
jgi:organic radical activating enzyme